MDKKRHCLFILWMWFSFYTWGAVGYSTARLQAMASQLPLPGIDTLSCGEYHHFLFQSHPLTVRINNWEEVEHLGLYLFPQEMKESGYILIYDFLERHLLERILADGTDEAIRLGIEHVRFEQGTYRDALKLDGTEEFRIVFQTYKSYCVEWRKEQKTFLKIYFDMDYQLLSGCNSIELEKNYLKKIGRYRADMPHVEEGISFPLNSDYYVKPGATFLIDAIRNELYYHKVNEEWLLMSDEKKPYQSIPNILLSRAAKGNYDLAFTLDMYGYQEERDTVRLQDWLGLCEQEGCISYFGMKSKTDSAYLGTVFMVNEKEGFIHMLSVTFPFEVLKQQRGNIKGRLFVYIPLHNISSKYLFMNSYYKKEEDENEN